MASAEAVARRRVNRRLAKLAKEGSGARPVHPSIVKSTLTIRQIAVLRERTEPLFLSGEIDLRFMGIRYLELAHHGWTPDVLQADLAIEHWEKDERDAWADVQFEAVFNWYGRLSEGTRASLLEDSRGMGISGG